MKALNIISLISIAIMGFFLYKLMMASKKQQLQTDALMVAAIKSGMIKIDAPSKKKALKQEEEYDDDEDDGNNAKEPKKVKLKKIQKQTVSLFSDGIPKQIGELRNLYMGKFSDITKKATFYNTLYNLRPSNVLNFEKIENTNYWGLGEWFDQDGSMFEDYIEKITITKEIN